MLDIVWRVFLTDYNALLDFQEAKCLSLVSQQFYLVLKPLVNKLYKLHKSSKSPYKIVVVGDYSVGKSNILSQFKYNTFRDELNFALKEDFIRKFVFVENNPVLLQVWDSPRPAPYCYQSSKYWKACGAIIVFDITNQMSFDNVLSWLLEIQLYCMELSHIALVGNKSDLTHKRAVHSNAIKGYAERMAIPYFETSAKTGEGIENLFQKFTEDMVSVWSKVQQQRKAKNTKKCVIV